MDMDKLVLSANEIVRVGEKQRKQSEVLAGEREGTSQEIHDNKGHRMMEIGSEKVMKQKVEIAVKKGNGIFEELGTFYMLRVPCTNEGVEIDGIRYIVLSVINILSKTCDPKIRLLLL